MWAPPNHSGTLSSLLHISMTFNGSAAPIPHKMIKAASHNLLARLQKQLYEKKVSSKIFRFFITHLITALSVELAIRIFNSRTLFHLPSSTL